jgi:hypothetical protein
MAERAARSAMGDAVSWFEADSGEQPPSNNTIAVHMNLNRDLLHV